jgi:hypothetical protein
MKTHLRIIYAALLGLTSCFDLVQSKDDNAMYRINRLTGSVDRVIGQTLTPTQVFDPYKADSSGELSRSWNELGIKGDKIKVNLKTRWIDNRLYYLVNARPASLLKAARENSYGARLGLELLTEGGLKINAFPVSLDEMTQIVDNQNQGQSFTYSGSLPMTLDTFRSISNWTTTWNF